MSHTSGTARVGVIEISLRVERDIDWAFREQPINDFGIDAQAEERLPDGSLTGRLIAIQIKSGPSYFNEATKAGYAYRGDEKHIAYWQRHSLPVVIVLHNPDTGVTIWESVSADKIRRTGKGWKIVIPSKNSLDVSARSRWSALAEGPPYQRRLRRLVLARPWMELISEDGKELFLEFEEWINKSSGRGAMRLLARDENGDEEVVEDWGAVAFPGQIFQEVIHYLFPWAEFYIDENYYEVYDDALHIAETGSFDGGELVLTYESLTEWRRKQPRIRPYIVEAGEIAKFRLEIVINELGAAFSKLDQYLETGKLHLDSVNMRMSLDYGTGLKSTARRYGIPPIGDTYSEEGSEE